jgi:hypothetical protein
MRKLFRQGNHSSGRPAFDAATGTADTYIDSVHVDADTDPPLVQGLGTAPTAGFRIGTFRSGTARFFEG